MLKKVFSNKALMDQVNAGNVEGGILGDIKVDSFEVGNSIPVISDPKLVDISGDGGVSVELGFCFLS